MKWPLLRESLQKVQPHCQRLKDWEGQTPSCPTGRIGAYRSVRLASVCRWRPILPMYLRVVDSALNRFVQRCPTESGRLLLACSYYKSSIVRAPAFISSWIKRHLKCARSEHRPSSHSWFRVEVFGARTLVPIPWGRGENKYRRAKKSDGFCNCQLAAYFSVPTLPS